MELKDMIVEKKNMPFPVKTIGGGMAIKDVDSRTGIITGLFSSAYYYDSDNDIILPGANSKSINERGVDSSATAKIKHLKDHVWGRFVSKLMVLDEREIIINGQKIHGTYFEGKASKNSVGRDTLIEYEEGIIDNHSYGFKYMQGTYCEEGDETWNKILPLLLNPEDMQKAGFAYVWSECKMYEGSTVTFGANELTPFLGMKDKSPAEFKTKVFERIDLLEKQLRHGTQTDETMYGYEMQVIQLKQMLNEFFTDIKEPSTKDKIVKSPSDVNTHDTNKGLTLDSLGASANKKALTIETLFSTTKKDSDEKN